MTLEEARARLEEGDLERAREALRRALEADPERLGRASRPRLPRARSRQRRTRRPQLFRQALEREPGNIDALRAIATIHGRSGRAEDAFDAAAAVAEAQPEDPLAVLELAELALDLGRLDEAASAFQRLRSVDDDPSHEVYAFHGLIEVELHRENWRRALDLAVDATRVDRAGRTTDILAYVVAQVFGGGRPRGSRACAGRRRARALARRAPAAAPGGLVMAQTAAPPKPGTDIQWTRCPACDAFVYYKRLQRNLGVCPECNYHFRIPVATRLEQLLDEGSFEDLSGDLEPLDALGFADSKPYSAAHRGSAEEDRLAARALTYGTATIGEHPLVVAGDRLRLRRRLHGERGRARAITRAAELALEQRHAAARRLRLGRRPHAGGLRLADADGQDERRVRAAARGGHPRTCRLLTDPTYGGVSASFATLGDVLIAEPTAHIGFAGPEGDRADDPPEAPGRLPDGRVPAGPRHARPGRAAREPRRTSCASCSSCTRAEAAASARRGLPDTEGADARVRSGRARRARRPGTSCSSPRDIERPNTLEYVGCVFDDFQELHGDRLFGDDAAIVGGLGAARRARGHA